jgi:hypothetical protein
MPKRSHPPQPTNEDRKKVTPPPSPRVGRDTARPTLAAAWRGEGGSGGGGLRFGVGAVSPERERRAAHSVFLSPRAWAPRHLSDSDGQSIMSGETLMTTTCSFPFSFPRMICELDEIQVVQWSR